MSSWIFCSGIVLAMALPRLQAELTVLFDETMQECGNKLPFPAMDISGVDVFQQEDGTVILNGSIHFLDDYYSPVTYNLRTQRLERGTWVPAIVSRYEFDLCPTLQRPMELWYPFTKNLQQKQCPLD
ncbi:uncharacterized protein LOC129741881 [Uranotaenia lowii]|uniref:uncharacterized protein LOC129741881 n=1 Tax=Uranotaenia lowii TaxID=190385 RepID=UPI00247A701E|nr:uncharacterized protein LOC129741881 [Uranotaenia lowii]